MRTAELVNLLYFSLLTLLALVWPLPSRARVNAGLVGLLGLGLTGVAVGMGRWQEPNIAGIVRDWLPVPTMAVAYWQSGCFFQKANARLQGWFEVLERKLLRLLRVDLTRWAQTWVGAGLELAYALCYPVVPLGLGALYVAGFKDASDKYWSVVLLSAYPCYLLLLFVQLLPPRLVERTDEAGARRRNVRTFNLWLVRRITHEANTFPSGHVAASVAIALVLLRFVPMAGIVFTLIALGIAVGCVVGRYHYVIDVGAALLLAGAVFGIVGL